MQKFTEEDLDNLIEEKISSCSELANVCSLLQTEEGKKRIKTRVKELVFNDGIVDIDACLGHIESELTFTEEDE